MHQKNNSELISVYQYILNLKISGEKTWYKKVVCVQKFVPVKL